MDAFIAAILSFMFIAGSVAAGTLTAAIGMAFVGVVLACVSASLHSVNTVNAIE